MKVQAIGHNGKGRGSAFIMRMTRGDQSHASLRFQLSEPEIISIYGKTGLVLTPDHEIESIQFKGVHRQPFVPSDNQTWFDFDHTSDQAEAILLAVLSKIGCKYDWSGIGGFVTRRDCENPDKWFCSELADWGMLQGGIRSTWTPSFKLCPTEFFSSTIFRVSPESPIQIAGR